MSHDLVIRKGNLADGRGSPLYQADIAIDDGVISKIGNISERGREELDARGLLVARSRRVVLTRKFGRTWRRVARRCSVGGSAYGMGCMLYR